MANALVRDLDDQVYERLKAARWATTARWRRSCARSSWRPRSRSVWPRRGPAPAEMRQRLSGRTHSDSAELIREDRDTR